ncbi:MAG: hypothetical protein GX557_01740 [Chloroflexi bacterium]|nr:hypothetical protein [Chloroflexota bacterium]
MPFAAKFRAMMGFPMAGETLGAFDVESVEVRDLHELEGYHYGVRLVLRGPGGQAEALRALRPLFAQHPTTFSGYGNPYQLHFGKPQVEGLGDRRYAVTVKGFGTRVYLEQDLQRFLEHLHSTGRLGAQTDEDSGRLVADYLEDYRHEIRLKVGRYRSALERHSR